MADESPFNGATLRDRFVATVVRDDDTAAQRLTPNATGPEGLHAQREDAWRLLSAGVGWAAEALESVSIDGTDRTAIRDSEAAFQRAQHLDAQLWTLGQQSGFHDAVALLVESVKRACYRGAELGPTPGGRLGSFRPPAGSPSVIEPIDPDPEDLRAIGSDLGQELRWFAELELGDAVGEALAALSPDALPG